MMIGEKVLFGFSLSLIEHFKSSIRTKKNPNCFSLHSIILFSLHKLPQTEISKKMQIFS